MDNFGSLSIDSPVKTKSCLKGKNPPNKKTVEALLRSKDCMQVVTEFLVVKDLLEL